jgi:hypothetical protein
MTYNMQAEGINGVTEKTVIVNNGWGNVPAPPGDTFVLVVNANEGEVDLAALQCIGSGKGPGVVGQTVTGFGGVGVAGFSQIQGNPTQGATLHWRRRRPQASWVSAAKVDRA